MILDFSAQQPHYVDHLAPIWKALGDDERGVFHMTNRAAHPAANHHGIVPTADRDLRRRSNPIVVAGWPDLRPLTNLDRDVVFVEHGTGQSYGTRSESYSGGKRRDAVSLFLAPNEHVHQANLRGTPGAVSVVVGSPRLDDLLAIDRPTNDRPCVAVSFHWDAATGATESRSAFSHHHEAIVELANRSDLEVIGHAHPRRWASLSKWYAEKGIEPVGRFDDVVARADLYVCDNSSTMFEFAALDRPVVVLNAPWYRRDADHGLRFWEFADVGIQVDHPQAVDMAVDDALRDCGPQQERRREIVDQLYPMRGRATEAALVAIRDHLECI